MVIMFLLPKRNMFPVFIVIDLYFVLTMVCIDDGIDELVEFSTAGKVIDEWTVRLMGGSVPFEEALAARLDLFKPSLALCRRINDLVQKLKESGKTAYLISGGFRQIVCDFEAKFEKEMGLVQGLFYLENDGTMKNQGWNEERSSCIKSGLS
ncbi:phosphoserine phosphatase, chloroplastic [Tanacetum coccineum]